MKALIVRQMCGRPSLMRPSQWYPLEGSTGLVAKAVIPQNDFVGELTLWDGELEDQLRMINIWDERIRVEGETDLPANHPLFQKIEEYRRA